MSWWYRSIRPLVRVWTRYFIWMYPRGLYLLAGRSYLLLETQGRLTGQRRITPLGYVRWGNSFLLQPLHGATSAWMLNIRANPQVNILAGKERRAGVARLVEDVAQRREALAVIAAAGTVGALTARRHFGLLSRRNPEALERVSHDQGKYLVIVEPANFNFRSPRQS